ncbi:MAG: phosphoribosylglycinamide formyltransferase [Thiotrichales bacterium]|nr:MAG: phosphoribosylglycinamide formyltransferase [Thiotrichales bacterium]
MTKKSIVILISGSGTNLQAIIDAVERGDINASITAVISNRADAKGLQRAQRAHINTIVVEQGDHPDRESYDQVLIAEVDRFQPDLIVLAGFMRILSDQFINHYQDAILNIHPSLLPALKGLHTHRRALEAALQVHGASVHFVSNELDSGPVVIQAEVPVLQDDTEASLADRVLQQEHNIYPMAIAWFVDGRLKINGNDVLLDGKVLNRPALWKADQLVISEQH